MRKLIEEYKQSLSKLRNGKVVPLHRSSMISDTQFAIGIMETGQISGTKWTVTISTVNPAKCLVLLTPSTTGNPGNGIYTPSLVSISSTSFVVTGSYLYSNSPQPFSWQVIEFM